MMTTSEIVIPKWLDENFIEKALRECDKTEKIIVSQIIVRPATSSGDNYGSIMFRVIAKCSTNSGYGDKVYTKSLIVKAIPDEEKTKTFITENDSFTTETEVLRRLIPSFHRLLNNSSEKHVHLSAKYYYHTDQPNQKLVLEDLCELGLKMAQNRGGLDLDHSRLVLSHLGKFHAASVVLHRQDPHSLDSFLKHPHLKTADSSKNLLQYTFTTAANDLNAAFGPRQQYSEKLREIGRSGLERLRTAVLRNENGFNVLNHNDVWRNNIMFKYDEDGKVSDLTFVDFQFSYYGSPVIDLLFFIYSSCSFDVISSRFDELMECYHSSLSKTLFRLGFSDRCPSLDDFREEIEKRNFIGVFAALVVMPLTLISKDNVPELADVINNKPDASRSYFTEEIIEAILKFLPIFDKKGWLD